MSFTLSDLSSELLASILRYLPSKDVKRLELSGSSDILPKIRDTVEQWRLEMGPLQTFPHWAFNYPNLQHLHISSTKAFVKAPLKWSKQLPLPNEPLTALQTLDLDFLGSALALSSLQFHRSLNITCPNLTSLSCSSFGQYPSEWLQNLPPKLIELRLAATPDTSIVSLSLTIINFLPRSLKTLELDNIFLMRDDTDIINWPPSLRHLASKPALSDIPSTLESLHWHWGDVKPAGRLVFASQLPATLLRFSLSDGLLGKIILDTTLPPHLNTLIVDKATFWLSENEIIGELNYGELDSLFPSSLTDVRLSNILPSHIAFLPIFHLLKEVVVDSQLALNMDSHLLSASAAALPFPSSLTSVTFSESAPSRSLLISLPPTVTRIKAYIFSAEQCDALACLPTIRHLHILPDANASAPEDHQAVSSAQISSLPSASHHPPLPSSFWKRVCPTLETLITPLSKSLDPPREIKFGSNLASSSGPSSPSSLGSPSALQPAKEWALLGTRLKTFSLHLTAQSASQYRPEMVMRMLPTSLTSLSISIDRAPTNASDDLVGEAGPEWFLYFSRFTKLQQLSIRDSRIYLPNSMDESPYLHQRPFLRLLSPSLQKLTLELPILAPDALHYLPLQLESLFIKSSDIKGDNSFYLTHEHLENLPPQLVELHLNCPHDPVSSFFSKLPRTVVWLQDGPIVRNSYPVSPARSEASLELLSIKRRFAARNQVRDDELEIIGCGEEEEDGEELVEDESLSMHDTISSSDLSAHLDEQFEHLMSEEETEEFYESQREALRESQAIAKAMALGLPHPHSSPPNARRSSSKHSPSEARNSPTQLSTSGSAQTPTQPDRWQRNSLPWNQLHSQFESATMNHLEVDIANSDIEEMLLDAEYEGFYIIPRSPDTKRGALRANHSEPPKSPQRAAASAPQPISSSTRIFSSAMGFQGLSHAAPSDDPPARSSASSLSSDGFELI